MPVVASANLTLTADETAHGLTADHPVVGWQNVVTVANIVGAATNALYPASNMANPATHLRWQSTVVTAGDFDWITISPPATAIDYIAIARHNLAGRTVGVWYDAPGWFQLVADVVLPNNGPALFRFPAQVLPNLVLKITSATIAPQIAVVYAGKSLILPRKLYQGLAPINYARTAKVTNGRSEAGQFLGRIVLQEFVRNTIPLSLISPTYFRDHIAAFLVDSKANPFFFAWRPETYPNEIGYCHMTNDPVPTNEAPHGLVAMSLEMTGVI